MSEAAGEGPTTKAQEKVDAIWRRLLDEYPDGVSNTSTTKYNSFRAWLSELFEIDEKEIYITGAKTRPSNLDTRFVQGNQAGRHTQLGVGVMQIDGSLDSDGLERLSDSAVVTSRKFVDRSDNTSYDCIIIFVEFEGHLLPTRVIQYGEQKYHDILKEGSFEYQTDLMTVGGEEESTGLASHHSASDKTGFNKIFFGPPGTGKSHRANELIGSAVRTNTQFHPEYSYGDFVGSYRPVVGAHVSEKAKDPDGQEIPMPLNYFDFVPGPFMRAVADAISKFQASEDSPEPHYLLIDEINRGDCSSIFGDVFQLLDRDETGPSEYGIHLRPEIERWLDQKLGEGKWSIKNPGELSLPPNLFILGTMNTSDQNLYPMDSAFKRRWEWRSCSVESEYKILQAKYKRTPSLHDGHSTCKWICLIENLNRCITDRLYGMEDKQIGPWFIKPSSGGTVNLDSFSNKLLFYLWHDVFKDEQDSEDSPFNTKNEKGDATICTFGQLQDKFLEGGLQAIFKPDILKDCLVSSSDVGASEEEAKTSDENLPETPSPDESEEVAEQQDDSNE